jgi:hypothetical protein
MLFDDLKAKAFYVGLVKLEERGITRKAFEGAMVEHYNCVLTCATPFGILKEPHILAISALILTNSSHTTPSSFLLIFNEMMMKSALF